MAPYLTNKQKVGVVLALTMNIDCKIKQHKKKRLWSKQMLLKKEQLDHMRLTKELDDSDYRSCLRMDKASYNDLLNLVKPFITKQDTLMRQSVSAEDRLDITLKYLALGKDYSDLGYSYGISMQSMCKIIPETCEAIYKVLKTYLQVPETENEWLKIAEQYQSMWQFNHCIGSVGGRHLLIVKPKENGSLYYNYKGIFSVVLFAVVNANYEFLYVHTGTKGSLPDGPLLESTKFYDKLIEAKLNVPQASLLPGTNTLAPYIFIGDHGFGKDKHILEAYVQDLSYEKNIFNYRLSRAKRVVDNVFGILVTRFKLFQKRIMVDIQNVDKIVMASCVLHNYLRKKSVNYITNDCVAYENIENKLLQQIQWPTPNAFLPLQKSDNLKTEDDPILKKLFTDYYNGPGRVDFQDELLNVVNNYE